MKKALLLILVFNLAILKAEIRSLWVLPWNIKTPGAIDQLIEDAILNNQNELLVEVRYRSDALYTPNRLSDTYSNPEPRSYIMDGSSFDPLEYTLARAKEHGIRVQAWLVVFNATPLDAQHLSNNYIYQHHRDWLTTDSQGRQMRSPEQYGFFLDPGIPGVQNYLLDVFSDIVVSYPDLAGIHLDYVRYPSTNFGYHPISVSRYQEAKRSEELSWNEWRTRQVTQFVEKLRDRLKRIKPDLILSAAVFSNIYDARVAYAQDWFDWLNRGLIDYAYPMNYVTKYSSFSKQTEWMEDNGHTDKIVMGLRAWNARGGSLLESASPSYNINHIEERIRHIRSRSFAGIALFSYEGINKGNALSYLADRVFVDSETLEPSVAPLPAADVHLSQMDQVFGLDFVVPVEGRWHWQLLNEQDAVVYSRFRYYTKGDNHDEFEGTLANGEKIPPGTYLLSLYMPGTEHKYLIPISFGALNLE